MKPLIVLLAVFVSSLLVNAYVKGVWAMDMPGNIAMCAMLCFTALGHFKFTDGMAMMIPPPVPFKKVIVYVTGIIEVAAGAMLLFPSYRHATALVLIAFFILMLPANIYAAVKHVDYEKATYNGAGPAYLWFRVPLQVFFIAWVYYFSW
ncbi:DoxX family protein [Foetidibacter luteolus]|uniref:DoxX family protein n=1 Tax=Foetidibacter luteolus TaxID=2608880 RepID=UPI00129B244D|nr:MauE/DoxX family redox-associated membrane protein [Foetidibacter luteolus]